MMYALVLALVIGAGADEAVPFDMRDIPVDPKMKVEATGLSREDFAKKYDGKVVRFKVSVGGFLEDRKLLVYKYDVSAVGSYQTKRLGEFKDQPPVTISGGVFWVWFAQDEVGLRMERRRLTRSAPLIITIEGKYDVAGQRITEAKIVK